ncbi:hypothetical protein A1F94_006304 [Pyrenophora tritici-repentis]|nr:hypothetical protein A1F94_006304 [Pyrenophora tritici-repentis]
MTGRWQPYMYAAQRDSMADTDPTQPIFDPKAVTRASRMPASPPKKKKEGPLIDFNQHPDSYLVLPYGKTDAKPMTNKIKTFINIARWTQFALRLLTLCGAVGVLLCGIFIQGAQDSEGYIMRVPVSAMRKHDDSKLTLSALCGPRCLLVRGIPLTSKSQNATSR